VYGSPLRWRISGRVKVIKEHSEMQEDSNGKDTKSTVQGIAEEE